MADYNENARYVINAFLWDELKSSGILNESDYRPDGFLQTIIPIVPSQEIPEFNNLLPNATYIIYDYEVEGYSDDWFICEEIMSYTIVSSEYEKISQISEFMIDLFRRVDASGKDVQRFNPESSILKFYTVSLNSVSSPTPYESENGRMAGAVEIAYKYSRILNSSGRFA
jgi:hypothetical protein